MRSRSPSLDRSKAQASDNVVTKKTILDGQSNLTNAYEEEDKQEFSGREKRLNSPRGQATFSGGDDDKTAPSANLDDMRSQFKTLASGNGLELEAPAVTKTEAPHFIAFVEHCLKADEAIKAGNGSPEAVAVATTQLKLADTALKNLHSRPVAMACLALLSGIAAAAAVVFAWPVIAAGALAFGLNMACIGAASATAVSLGAATTSILASQGVFKKSKFNDLHAVKEALDEKNTQAKSPSA